MVDLDLDDYRIVKELHEDNIGVKIDDDEFETILDLAESETPDIRKRLADLNERIMGALLALDDYTTRFEYTKVQADPKEALKSENNSTRMQALMELTKQGDIETVLTHLRVDESPSSAVYQQMVDRIIRSPKRFLQVQSVEDIEFVAWLLTSSTPTDIVIDALIGFLEKIKDEGVRKRVQDYLSKHLEK